MPRESLGAEAEPRCGPLDPAASQLQLQSQGRVLDPLEELEIVEGQSSAMALPVPKVTVVPPAPAKTASLDLEEPAAAREGRADRRRLHDRSIAPDILKGVRLERALGGFGAYLGRRRFPASSYAEEVEAIDDFWSHAWGTSRYLKYIALCCAYNSVPAFFFSILLGLVVGTLEAFDFLPLLTAGARPRRTELADGSTCECLVNAWALLLCPVCFVVVLLYWQRLRSAFRRSIVVFFDKLCIEQSDQDRKTQGIMSLTGFLRFSNRVVVLWSPRYFTRLWCTFEVASWIYLQKPLTSIYFVPVHLSKLLVVLSLALWPIVVGYKVNLVFVEDLFYELVVGMVFSLPLAHAVRSLIQDQMILPDQLRNFSIRDAECYCCDHDHLDPQTGTKLLCDRELIYAMLDTWFSEPQESTPGGEGSTSTSASRADYLDSFDQQVRGPFRETVLRFTGGPRISYPYALLTTVPYAWFVVEEVPAYFVECGSRIGFTVCGTHLVQLFLTLPSIIALFFRVGHILGIYVGWGSVVYNCVVSFVYSVIMTGVGILMWTLPWVSNMVSSDWLPLALACIYALLTAALYLPKGGLRQLRRASTSMLDVDSGRIVASGSTRNGVRHATTGSIRSGGRHATTGSGRSGGRHATTGSARSIGRHATTGSSRVARHKVSGDVG